MAIQTHTTRHPVPQLPLVDDREYAEDLIRHVIDECPSREPTGDDELRAQKIFREELHDRGVHTHLIPYRFNKNLYAVLALHFGCAVAGSIAFLLGYPWVALGLHIAAGVSYLSEASHWGYILRRLFPFRRSQNLVGTLPAVGNPRLRIVMLGHADAAHTGFMFNPLMVSGTSNKPYPQPFGWVRKHMLFAVLGFFALGVVDVMFMATGQCLPLVFFGLTAGSLVGFALNLQVVLQNKIVPGASDNLSGCAALPILAQRFADKKPDDVELVFVVTGCEESGVGGSAALARQMEKRWSKQNTVVLGLDILSNGRLSYKTVNEVLPMGLPAWMIEACQDVAKRHPSIGELGIYDACAGTDDAVPFVAAGYDGLCLACSDPNLGVSQQYHLMSDTPDNMDFDQMIGTVDYVEDLVDEIIARRVAVTPSVDRRKERRVISHLNERATGAYAMLLSPLLWPLLGAAAGLYTALTLDESWPTLLQVFRGSLSALLLLFPLVVLLNRLGWNPDKKLLGNLVVVGVVAALGVTAVGLVSQPAVHAFLPELLAWSRSTALLCSSGVGLLCGLPVAALLAFRRR